ncbi:MAG: LacI family transcriptional regulator [Clostridia bacterium]|nr:LacI family transcriptional regulator [Clostridia bacterium]NCC75002.1 LacI family transcriptional regulator [Clostridia bacterium]
MHKKVNRLFIFYWPWLLIGLAVSALVAGLFLPLQHKPYPYRIIAIGKASTQGTAFWYSMAEGMAAAAIEFQVSVDYRSTVDESEVGRQIAIVNQAIAEKPDAIILAALDADRLVEPARAARAAGITVVMVDSALADVEKSPQQSFIATNNVLAGQQLGELVVQRVRPGAKILVISPSTRGDSLIGRETGVRAVIQDAFNVLPTLDTGGQLSDEIYHQVSQALIDHPDVEAIVCLNEYTTAGAARAIRGASLTGEVTLVGFDSSEELINYLEEGLLSAVVIQRPFNMGYLSVTRTIDLLNGRKVEPFYDTGSIVITKDNIYTEENQKLLFPFED